MYVCTCLATPLPHAVAAKQQRRRALEDQLRLQPSATTVTLASVLDQTATSSERAGAVARETMSAADKTRVDRFFFVKSFFFPLKSRCVLCNCVA